MSETATKTKVTVYTKASCVQCIQTIKALDKHNVAYELADAVASAATLKSQNLMSAPVVIIEGVDAWAGFRPDNIKKYFG